MAKPERGRAGRIRGDNRSARTLPTVRNAIVSVTLIVAVAAAAAIVGGFLVVVGTVKMFVWAGIEGAAAFWGVLVFAIAALIYKLSGQTENAETSTTDWKRCSRAGHVRDFTARLRTPRRPRR